MKMNKIWVILKREYLTRVKNKTFIVMTFMGPLIIALFYGGIILVAMRDAGDKTSRHILYNDESGFFQNHLDSVGNFYFTPALKNRNDNLKKVSSGEFHALLEIRDKDLHTMDSITWISKNTISVMQQEKLTSWLVTKVYNQHLMSKGLTAGTIDSLKPSASINLIEIDENGEMKKDNSGVKSGIGFALAFIIYMFIFLYGSMVMRSTLEEKTNRIVEVIISSVKPFHMMLGKILGVALVGLTQFAAWVILGLLGIVTVTTLFSDKLLSLSSAAGKGVKMGSEIHTPSDGSVFETLMNLPHLQIIVVFLVFFLGGFLLYSSMFAAIGAAVNQDTDMQQFMLPVSMPLIFGFVIAQTAVFQDPNGPMATVFSIIPFTSPVVMVVRSPFGVPWSQLMLSIAILVFTFIVFVWITARIYRVGILMYGKKPTWKELGKWIFMKD